jgi:acyl-CoA thioester hydrolase
MSPRRRASVSDEAKRAPRPQGTTARSSPRRRKPATPATGMPEEPAPEIDPAATAARTLARVPLAVRWGDLDAFNHVNNATFLVYAQEARLAWLAGVEGTWFDATMMPVVAAAQVNYRRQLAWPATVEVELAVVRLGRSSLTIAHRILDAGDAACVYADGEVVMVWVDPASGASVPLPEAIRRACTVPAH